MRQTDILIVGGGVGGCAAELSAARRGRRVILTEETDWVGGQLTAQAVPPDEHGWIEHFGCTASYRRFRNLVRDYYRTSYPLTRPARNNVHLNPGNGWVSPLCHEPRVALAVLEGLLAPFTSSGRLTILRRYRPVSAQLDVADQVKTVTVENLETGTACGAIRSRMERSFKASRTRPKFKYLRYLSPPWTSWEFLLLGEASSRGHLPVQRSAAETASFPPFALRASSNGLGRAKRDGPPPGRFFDHLHTHCLPAPAHPPRASNSRKIFFN